MKTKRNRKEKNYRFIAELSDYSKLSEKQLDVALNGVPYAGKRYPLSYVFWREWKWRRVRITLTGEVGTLIGESHIKLLRCNIHRAVVKIGERITDLDYSVLKFM